MFKMKRNCDRTLLLALIIATGAIVLIQSSLSQALGGYIRKATQKSFGSVVPWPKNLTFLHKERRKSYLQINSVNLSLTLNEQLANCSIVKRAIERYAKKNGLLFDDRRPSERDAQARGLRQVGNLNLLNIGPIDGGFLCESVPGLNMIESYTLNIDKFGETGKLSAKSSWGLIRGLETFSQLIFAVEPTQGLFGIFPVSIDDEPRFKYRGYMLDTSRHFISMANIYRTLDAMATNKMNSFHWHLVDDQSFPYESISHPELSKLTSYRPEMVYSQKDVRDVMEYAFDRGIRVVPELDTPGHTFAMRSLPNFLTKCYDKSKKFDGTFGPINPTMLENYKIMSKFIKEFVSVFPDSYFHAGGDEVDFDCWKSNPEINQWMESKNITGNYMELQNIYIRKIYDLLAHNNRTMLVWQEVFDNNANLPKDSIIHVWKYRDDRAAYIQEMRSVVKAGYKAILSSCWYLDYIEYGQDWIKFYKCDPTADLTKSNDKESLKELVLGGEVCMWTEYVDDINVLSRTWPRASAAAERLWSPSTKTNVNDFLTRLEQLRCRLISRGVRAEPVNGPGYC